MKKKKFIQIMLLFLICLFSTLITNKVVSAEEVITKGVYIDSIDIGGMTVSEAEQAVQDYVDELRSKTITVKVDDNAEVITLGDLDFNCLKNNYVEQAALIGEQGNLINRYKEIKDVQNNKLVYNLKFEINDEKLNTFVEKKLDAYTQPAVNASVKRVNGQMIYTSESSGRKLVVKDTIADIKNAILKDWNKEDIEINAVVVDDTPKYTRDLVERCNTMLGTFSTNFASSTADRAGNLANGAKLINNFVLYPGEEFSAYKMLTPFTKENGYFVAGAYSNGIVIDSVGGGACQVTTTLYNAVLNAELEVTERSSHSMSIGYAELSRDAAIAGTWKDLKFKNNTDAPILIQGFTKGRIITFNIWGEETRPKNRRIEFESVTLKETAPGADVITKDPTKPTTYYEITQSAHTGYEAELYKIVYENNVEVSRTRVNKSVYNASPRYITVGTRKVKPAIKIEDETEKDSTQKDSTQKETEADKKPVTDETSSNNTDNNTDN